MIREPLLVGKHSTASSSIKAHTIEQLIHARNSVGAVWQQADLFALMHWIMRRRADGIV